MNEDEIIYRVRKKPDGKIECGVMFRLGPHGEIPFELSEEIRRVLGLDLDEDPISVPDGKGNVILKRNYR